MNKYEEYKIQHHELDKSISFLLDETGKKKYVKKVVNLVDIYYNEIRILTLLKNANINYVPKIVDHYIEFLHQNTINNHIIIYEYIEGVDLYDYTDKYELSTHDKTYIAFQLIDIVYQIHKLGIIHRDIKLENFVVSDDNKVYLIDFGLSTLISDTYELTEMIPGSKAYISHNYARLYMGLKTGTKYSKNKINAVLKGNDLFSLSITLYSLFNVDFPYVDDIRFEADYDFLVKTLRSKKYKESFHPTKGPENPILLAAINLHKERDYKRRILLWNSLTAYLK